MTERPRPNPSSDLRHLSSGSGVFRTIVVDHDDAGVLQQCGAHEDRGARPVVGVLLVVAGADIHLARVHRVTDGGAMEREALLAGGAHVRKVRMEYPVETGPAAEAASRPDQGLDLDILSLLEFRDLHQVSAHGGRT